MKTWNEKALDNVKNFPSSCTFNPLSLSLCSQQQRGNGQIEAGRSWPLCYALQLSHPCLLFSYFRIGKYINLIVRLSHFQLTVFFPFSANEDAEQANCFTFLAQISRNMYQPWPISSKMLLLLWVPPSIDFRRNIHFWYPLALIFEGLCLLLWVVVLPPTSYDTWPGEFLNHLLFVAVDQGDQDEQQRLQLH